MPAATLTVIVPVAFTGGVTTNVASVPLTRVNTPAVPPATAMSSAVKLAPTSSLKVKVNVTGPLAVSPAALLVMSTVGGVASSYFRRTWSSSTGLRRAAGTSKLSDRTAARSSVVPAAPWKAVKGRLICRQPVKLSANEAAKDTGCGAAW